MKLSIEGNYELQIHKIKLIMIFRKKDRLVGLDIGSSLIKAAVLKPTSRGYELHRFGIAQTEPGAITDGRIIDQQSLADSIHLLFKSLKIHEKNVAVSLGAQSVFIRTINIPAVSDDIEREKIIYSEAAQYLPYNMDEVNADYQILGENRKDSSDMDVLFAASHKDILNDYSKLIRRAGLRLRLIDADIFALQNAYNLLYQNNKSDRILGQTDQIQGQTADQSKESFTLLADIGASGIALNIFMKDRPFVIRDIMYGTGRIAEELAEESEITYEAANQALIRHSNDDDHQNENRIKDISLNAVQFWCREIAGLVNEFQSETPETKVENIVLSGGGALTAQIKEYLLYELDADISLIDPFKALVVKKKQFSETFLNKAAPWAAIAIGLALRRVNDKNKSLTF